MDWFALYPESTPPTPEAIAQFIETPLWGRMNAWLQQRYGAAPRMAYSKCSGQPGWNVKYQKGGKSLVTLYPMPGFFIALVVVGPKEQHAAELSLPLLSEGTRALYARTPFSAGGHWLMLPVADDAALQDAKTLIALRVKPKAG